MMKKGKMERGMVELVDTESLVPQEHLLRKVDKAVDFWKLYEIVEPLYSEEDGLSADREALACQVPELGPGPQPAGAHVR